MSDKKMTFEETLAALESIADRIEKGQVGLEDSITLYEQGMKLMNQCRLTLEKAELRIKQVQAGPQQEPVIHPADSFSSDASGPSDQSAS